MAALQAAFAAASGGMGEAGDEHEESNSSIISHIHDEMDR